MDTFTDKKELADYILNNFTSYDYSNCDEFWGGDLNEKNAAKLAEEIIESEYKEYCEKSKTIILDTDCNYGYAFSFLPYKEYCLDIMIANEEPYDTIAYELEISIAQLYKMLKLDDYDILDLIQKPGNRMWGEFKPEEIKEILEEYGYQNIDELKKQFNN